MSQKKQQAAPSGSEKDISRSILLALAFAEGALVIVSEMLGAKLMASFFGNSLAVWTSVITVTVTFLTLGYFFGGKLSQKQQKRKKLAFLFIIAAFFMACMPVWANFFFIKFSESTLVGGAIGTAIFLIGPSTLCLGMSSPIIIQLLNEHGLNAGSAAGKTYAISTLAGILSTLIIGFYLLPNLGISVPLMISAFILLALSFWLRFSYLQIGIALLVVILFVTDLGKKEYSGKLFKQLYLTEGMMGQLKVMDQRVIGSDLNYRLLFINGIPQTIIQNSPEVNSFWKYVHRISSAASLKKGKKALLIGVGGGALAHELQQLDFELDMVDIDRRMFEIAQKHFYFQPDQDTKFTEDDARHFIKTCSKKYDLIVLDICSGEVQPSNVFTSEGIEEMKKILSPDGLILIQYQEMLDPVEISGSQSIAKTFRKADFEVYVNIEEGDISSVVMACSPQKTDFSLIDSTHITPNVWSQNWKLEEIRSAFQPYEIKDAQSLILTDDRPILEHLNGQTIEAWRKTMIKNYGLPFLQTEND
ncbi:MAG: methyltransferase domain-containing protein [Bacteroidetes bacterium]|nr:MAG: methyltransferase domain-containing protein [Bacteroidota bacterium]